MITDEFKEIPLVAQLIEKFYSLEERDQLALKIVSIFFMLIFLFLMVIKPVYQYQSQAQTSYRENLELYSLIKSNEQVFESYSQPSADLGGQSLLGLANSSSKSFGISFKRFEPIGDDGLSLWIESAAFNNVIRWLDRLDRQYGIKVNEIDVDRQSGDDLVDVHLVLQG